MKVVPFIAGSAAEAVNQIRAELGPEAVVLNVRQISGNGLSRLWQKPRIEVIACLPDPQENPANADSLAEIRQEIAALRQQMPVERELKGLLLEPQALSDKPEAQKLPTANSLSASKNGGAGQGEEVLSRVTDRLASVNSPPASPTSADKDFAFSAPASGRDYGAWQRAGSMLESAGLLPHLAGKVVDRLRAQHGPQPPALAEELEFIRATLRQHWPPAPARTDATTQTHIFIGAPGAGKTTCLCKWMVQSVLLENATARALRLDSHTANTAESLSVFCDIVGVPVARSLAECGPDITMDDTSLFVDLPGVNWTEPGAIATLAQQLQDFPGAQIHLVLNTAYELHNLLAQVRAFAALPITDLIFTHLDEERRWGKIWNFPLGTNYQIRFLSSGQNIPGGWMSATGELLLGTNFL